MDRRQFVKLSAAAAAVAMIPSELTATGNVRKQKKQGEDNRSNFNGVQIGAITYSFRSQGKTVAEMLLFSLGSGLGAIELMAPSVYDFTGTPAEKVEDWKLGTPEAGKCLQKYKELGDIFRAAGIGIHIIKFSPKAKTPDAAIDFMFEACKAIGADGISTELDFGTAGKVAPFAEKHGKYLIFHNHGQPSKEDWKGFDAYLKYGKNIMLNFDAGHYFGYTGKNPCEIIEKYHDRIYSIHLKDKTSISNTALPNKNQIWGKGETPIAEILKLVRKHSGEAGWPVHCDIELEYPVPADSDSVAEVKKCVEYCKKILL